LHLLPFYIVAVEQPEDRSRLSNPHQNSLLLLLPSFVRIADMSQNDRQEKERPNSIKGTYIRSQHRYTTLLKSTQDSFQGLPLQLLFASQNELHSKVIVRNRESSWKSGEG